MNNNLNTSTSQSQQTLTPREKLYQETLIIEQSQLKPDFSDKNLQEWPVQINGVYIYLNNLNYLNFCFQKTEVLLKESKNFHAPLPIGKFPPPTPISKTSDLRYHIFDLEEPL